MLFRPTDNPVCPRDAAGAWFTAVYVAHGGKLTGQDETPAAEDDSTT